MSVTAFAFAVSVTFAATMVAVMPVLFVMMTVATMVFPVMVFIVVMSVTAVMSLLFKLFQLAFKALRNGSARERHSCLRMRQMASL